MLGRLCLALARHEGGVQACVHEGALIAASRSLDDVSTSYSASELSFQRLQRRYMAKKSAKKGSGALTSTDGVVLTPSSQIQHPEHTARLLRLKWRRRRADHTPVPLEDSQRALIEQFTAAGKGVDTRKAEAATSAGQEPQSTESNAMKLKQLGLPLNQRDIVKLVHKTFSGVAEQNVHFRPYVFTNLFQSAPAVASYVANALESGTSWQRIERFFLSSVEVDPGIGAIRVQVKGRIGRKATMASTKVWEHGQLRLHEQTSPIDHGMATALTRVGVLGIQVWVRFVGKAVANSMYQRSTGMSRPLTQLLAAKRDPLPFRSSSAWWNKPGPAQPALNRTWEVFKPDYPSTSMPIADYIEAHKPKTFSHDAERTAAQQLIQRQQSMQQKQIEAPSSRVDPAYARQS